MKRPWQSWLMFVVFVGVLVAAMGWISQTMLRLEHEQIKAQQRSLLEENVRLALWRMDSFLSPIIAQEQIRPYYMYRSYYPPKRAYDNMLGEYAYGEVLLASDLMRESWPYVSLHFQFAPDGSLTSPKAPSDQSRERAINDGYVSSDQLVDVEVQLERLRVLKPLSYIQDNCANLEATGAQMPAQPSVVKLSEAVSNQVFVANTDQQTNFRLQDRQQRVKNQVEWAGRNNNALNNPSMMQYANNDKAGIFDTCEGYMTPMWFEDNLLLARRVSVRGQIYIQGCVLDWAAIKTQMESDVEDLLPEATLLVTRNEVEVNEGRMLANLPVQLNPGGLPSVISEGSTPIQASLAVAWACLLLTISAVGVWLRGVLVLSERRGAFVSAVTHEMRTPLTTFRMYTEMLLHNMVPDEEKRKSYLKTLSVEAHRLGHMVENVLAYARLEGNGRAGRSEPVRLGEIMAQVTQRLEDRAAQSRVDFVVETEASVEDCEVLADASAVEHILFNLVDNACKYAAQGDPRTIRLSIRPHHRSIGLSVRDHGPGIRAREARDLFKPFRKSAHQAAESSPGVGLGLALSRRLARRMKGDLIVERKPNGDGRGGACFILTLPLASRSS